MNDHLMNHERHQATSQQNSALAIILQSRESNQEQKAQLLSCEVMQKLLEEKWNVFARRQFMWRFTLLMSYLICMSVAIYLRRDQRRPAQLVSINIGIYL